MFCITGMLGAMVAWAPFLKVPLLMAKVPQHPTQFTTGTRFVCRNATVISFSIILQLWLSFISERFSGETILEAAGPQFENTLASDIFKNSHSIKLIFLSLKGLPFCFVTLQTNNRENKQFKTSLLNFSGSQVCIVYLSLTWKQAKRTN